MTNDSHLINTLVVIGIIAALALFHTAINAITGSDYEDIPIEYQARGFR